MAELSPAARAVLTAVTWKKYDVPPEGLPAFAEEMAPLIAAALRAAVKYTRKQKVLRTLGVPMVKSPVYCLESTLLAIATELENHAN